MESLGSGESGGWKSPESAECWAGRVFGRWERRVQKREWEQGLCVWIALSKSKFAFRERRFVYMYGDNFVWCWKLVPKHVLVLNVTSFFQSEGVASATVTTRCEPLLENEFIQAHSPSENDRRQQRAGSNVHKIEGKMEWRTTRGRLGVTSSGLLYVRDRTRTQQRGTTQTPEHDCVWSSR